MCADVVNLLPRYFNERYIMTQGTDVSDEKMSRNKSRKETIHSGQFMVSDFEATAQDDEEDEIALEVPESPESVECANAVLQEIQEPDVSVPVRFVSPSMGFARFGTTATVNPTWETPITIDSSLTKLFQCMSLAYRQKLTSPKWNRFKGLKLNLKDKIRLNNVIWRCWHMQFITRKKPLVVQFASPLDVDQHNKPEAVVLEGKYWKRKLSMVTAEYKKWRIFYKNKIMGWTSKEPGDFPMIDSFDWQSRNNWSSSLSTLSFDDDLMDFTDTLFSSLSSQPFAFPNPREIARAGIADVIQPSLVQLQPNLDDFMDFEPLHDLLNTKLPTVPEEGDSDDVFGRLLADQTPNVPPSTMPPSDNYLNMALGMSQQTQTSAPDGAGMVDIPVPSELSMRYAGKPYTETNRFDAANAYAEILQMSSTKSMQMVNNEASSIQSYYSSQPTSTSPQSPISPPAAVAPVYSQLSPPVPAQTRPVTKYTPILPSPHTSPPPPPPPPSVPVYPQTRQKQKEPPVCSSSVGKINTAERMLPATSSKPERSAGKTYDDMVFAVPKGRPRARSRSGSSLHQMLNQTSPPLASASSQPSLASVDSPVVTAAAGNALLAQLLTGGIYSTSNQKTAHPYSTATVTQHVPILPAPSNSTPSTPQTLLLSPVPLNSTPRPADYQNKLVLGSSNQTVFFGATSKGHADIQSSALFGVPSPPSPSASISSPTSPASPTKPFRPKTDNEKVQYKEHRRVCHINAEQKRRCNIKNGFDMVHSLIPQLSQNPNAKVSKATMLHKAAEYITQLKAERSQIQEETDKIRQQIETLNAAISNCQALLPATGAPISRQRSTKMNEMFDEWVRNRTLQNWRFWLFSFLMKPLFESYTTTVSTANVDDMCRTTLTWVDQHCTLFDLRPAVLNSLRYLSTSTEILTKPEKLPEEATRAVTKQEKKTNQHQQTQ